MELEVPYCKVYRIPFRPEYLLIEGPPDVEADYTNHWNMVTADKTTGRNVKAFRFHLAPEAIDLIIKQDATVTHTTGFCSLEIKFDAADCGYAMIEARRGVFVEKP